MAAYENILRVTGPAKSRNLATVESAVQALRLSSPSADDLAEIARLIRRASGTIEAAIGRPLIRQKYREGVPVAGKGRLHTTRFPLAGAPSCFRMLDPNEDFDKDTSDLEEVPRVYVADRMIGTITNAEGWGINSTNRFHSHLGSPGIVPNSEQPLIRVDYWAGWHAPGQTRLEGCKVMFDAETSSISMLPLDSSGEYIEFPTRLQKGDIIEVSGSQLNDGRYTLRTITPLMVQVEATVFDEVIDLTVPESVTIDARDLPEDLEDACLILARGSWFSRGADSSVQSEKVGDLSVTYNRQSSLVGVRGGAEGSELILSSLPHEVRGIVDSYRSAV